MRITLIILAIIGGFYIIERVIKFLGNLFPVIDAFKSKITIPLAKKWKFRRLVREAITSDIKGNVNTIVRKIQKELPNGWTDEMDIEWVENESKEDFLDNKRMVIRMRPLDDQALNFVNATYYFFKKALFPGTKRVVPEIHRETSVLHLCHRLIQTKKREYIGVFEDNILEDAIQKKETILNYLERYEYIDKKGFFTGAFIREIHEIAKKIRFKKEQKKIKQEINGILEHIENFIKDKDIGDIMPDQEWHRTGLIGRYSFLLIARPETVSIESHIYRAKKAFETGTNRLYIFGTASEKKLAEDVIEGICKSIPKCKLLEIFGLSYDYRGNEGGIGALFCLKNKDQSLL